MQDGIIAGNGNSRYLKTVAAALSLYPDYESFMAALIAGTFPIDLNGINKSGWIQQGTALNKANLFSDSTASSLGLSSSATPDGALSKLKDLIDSTNTNANTRAKVQLVYYQGTDTYGESGATSITFSFAPKAVICLGKVIVSIGGLQAVDRDYTITVPMELLSASYTGGWGFGYGTMGKKSQDGKTLTWYSQTTAQGQFNQSAYRYYYLGIG